MVSRSSKFSHRHYDYRKVLLRKYLAVMTDEELGMVASVPTIYNRNRGKKLIASNVAFNFDRRCSRWCVLQLSAPLFAEVADAKTACRLGAG